MRRARPSRLALLAALVSAPSLAADLSVTGTWSVALDASDLQAGAGSDLSTEQQSASAEVVLDVSGLAAASDAWRVEVSRADVGWPPGVRLWVTRSGAGTGPGSVGGGTGWIEVTGLPTPFFSGAGDRAGIGVRLRLTGLSVGLSPDAFASNVTYTVVDTP